MATDRKLATKLNRRRRWAGLVLRLEYALALAAPGLALVVAFLIVSLFGGWDALPFWAHLAGLVLFAAALVAAAASAVLRFRRPPRDQVDRRLEAEAGLRHQPILSAEDRPADQQNPATAALWQAHQRRQRARLEALPFVAPRGVLARVDPWAVRAGLGLVLVIAAVEAGPSWRDRLAGAFVPQLAAASDLAQTRLDLWLTPPDYTGLPPVVRSEVLPLETSVATTPIVVPVGSEMVVKLHDADARPMATPRFRLEPLPMDDLGAGSRSARLIVEESGALEVIGTDEDAPLAVLAIEAVTDSLPSVAFAGTPAATHRGVLNPRFEAQDDYGLVGVELELALNARPDAAERVPVRALLRPRRELAESAYVDLTPHPFAGQEVTARLVATDVAEQEGASAPLSFVLPERTFNNPVARAIIAARKELVTTPAERRAVAARLNIMAQSPRLAAMEAGVPLALRAASTRLVLNADGGEDRSVLDLLWEVALYVEEGSLSVAERDLRELERALAEALERGADDAELAQLMDELQQAIDTFLDALQQQALEQMQGMQPGDPSLQPLDPNAQMLGRQDFSDMLDQLRDAMQAGAREQAQEMLAELRSLLENLQTAMQTPAMGPMQQNMGALQELIRRQQDLLDQSFEMQQGRGNEPQQGGPGQSGAPSPGGQSQAGQGGLGDAQQLSGQQEAIRRALGDLMRRLGESGQGIPRSLGQSELQMRGAEQALGQGQPGEAIGPQTDALDLLQQGAGQLMEQMQQQAGPMPGQPGEGPGMGSPLTDTRDPLGRPLRNDGGASPYGTAVPEQPDLGTAHEVLRELQRRSGDSDRPAPELDYLERLLQRF